MTKSWEDKRSKQRIPVDFEVSFTFENKQHQARALNLSPDGMFLHTEYMLLRNDLVEVFFRIPDVTEPFWMKARVAWGTWVETPRPTFSGMGIQFLEPLPSQREALERYLEQISES